MTEAQNLLFIFSDEHTRDIAGAYGNDLVKTPNLDALAARGTRFDAAYCNCPICVPSRASLATGRYVHDVACWDNANPYTGTPPGWGHHLIAEGHEVAAIGKLHYRSAEDPTGFSEQINTLHVVDGVGDLLGLLRRDPPHRGNAKQLAAEAGPGESTYTKYDRSIAANASKWLRAKAEAPPDKPWLLFVGFVLPHFPLVSPPEFFAMYPPEQMPVPRMYGEGERPSHPVLDRLRQCLNYNDYFDEKKMRIALSAYFGMVSFLDHNIGQLMKVLDETGLSKSTRIVYTSDHGDNLGNRGLWGKSVMYEESVAVPLIMAGKDIPEGKAVSTPVSLVDLAPTFVEALGEQPTVEERKLPGRSLFEIIREEPKDRAVLSEYHAVGYISGAYMLRKGQWKLVYYVGHPSQLFDLGADPHETRDLGLDPAYATVRDEMEAELRKVVDPEAANARAFADQDAMIAKHGGREAIIARGDFGYTPAPGQTPVFE